MGKLAYFRVTALTLSIASVLFLVSCGTQDQGTNTQQNTTQVSQNLGAMDFVSQIPERFTTNADFLSCARQNLDMCMQEISFMDGGDTSVNCDDFLSEQSRESCRYTLVTSQAQNENNISLCAELDGVSRDRCELEISLAIAIDSGDLSVCEGLSDFDRIDCNNRIVYAEASRNLDISMCNDILPHEGDEENFEAEMCRNDISFMIEMQEQQASFDAELNEVSE
ncbi:hypothetical protein LAT59_04690 [Candidatus Gracilibacteria bacterium]|nr:hypothetical protein [Candidatus Gracilibacteria bacterium]